MINTDHTIGVTSFQKACIWHVVWFWKFQANFTGLKDYKASAYMEKYLGQEVCFCLSLFDQCCVGNSWPFKFLVPYRKSSSSPFPIKDFQGNLFSHWFRLLSRSMSHGLFETREETDNTIIAVQLPHCFSYVVIWHNTGLIQNH